MSDLKNDSPANNSNSSSRNSSNKKEKSCGFCCCCKGHISDDDEVSPQEPPPFPEGTPKEGPHNKKVMTLAGSTETQGEEWQADDNLFPVDDEDLELKRNTEMNKKLCQNCEKEDCETECASVDIKEKLNVAGNEKKDMQLLVEKRYSKESDVQSGEEKQPAFIQLTRSKSENSSKKSSSSSKSSSNSSSGAKQQKPVNNSCFGGSGCRIFFRAGKNDHEEED